MGLFNYRGGLISREFAAAYIVRKLQRSLENKKKSEVHVVLFSPDDAAETENRRRSMTLGSRPTRPQHHVHSHAHVAGSNGAERQAREPHVIDSSRRGNKASTKTEDSSKR